MIDMSGGPWFERFSEALGKAVVEAGLDPIDFRVEQVRSVRLNPEDLSELLGEVSPGDDVHSFNGDSDVFVADPGLERGQIEFEFGETGN